MFIEKLDRLMALLIVGVPVAIGAVPSKDSLPPKDTVTSKCTFSVKYSGVYQFNEKFQGRPLSVIETYRIPLKSGVDFAWSISLATNCKVFHYVEKITFPRKPKKLSSEYAKGSVSSDGKTITFDRSEVLRWESVNEESLAMITEMWTDPDEDLEGITTFDILSDGKSIAKFQIEFFKTKSP